MSQELQKDYFDLKVETLRLKGQLFDKGTRLPTLPAVLEDVRKLAEGDGTVGLIILAIDQPGKIEETYGWESFDRLLAQTAYALERALIQAGAQHLMAMSGTRSNKFLLFVKAGGGGEQQLAALQRAVEAAVGKAQLIPGLETRDIVAAGHALVRLDNRMRFERQVYHAADLAGMDAVRSTEIRVAALFRVGTKRSSSSA